MIRILLYGVGGVAALYLLLCALMFVFQRSLQYFPDPAPMDPAAAGLAGVTAETLKTADGERLVAWWWPPAAPDRPSFLYLHGNGGNLMVRAERFRRLTADGSGLLALSWRGYGGSTGSPGEAGFLADARAARAALAARVAPDRIVIVGESIGTAVATMLAAEARPAGLLLDSSFTSAADIAAPLYPWVPVRLLMRDPLHADEAAPRVAAPVLQLHCRRDGVTPLPLAQRLGQLFPDHRPMLVVEDTCHTVPADILAAAAHRFAGEVVR